MKVKDHKEFKQWLKGKPRQFLTVGGQLYCDCEQERPDKIRWTHTELIEHTEAFYNMDGKRPSHYFAYDPNLGDYEFVPHDSYSLLLEHFRTSNAA